MRWFRGTTATPRNLSVPRARGRQPAKTRTGAFDVPTRSSCSSNSNPRSSFLLIDLVRSSVTGTAGNCPGILNGPGRAKAKGQQTMEPRRLGQLRLLPPRPFVTEGGGKRRGRSGRGTCLPSSTVLLANPTPKRPTRARQRQSREPCARASAPRPPKMDTPRPKRRAAAKAEAVWAGLAADAAAPADAAEARRNTKPEDEDTDYLTLLLGTKHGERRYMRRLDPLLSSGKAHAGWEGGPHLALISRPRRPPSAARCSRA